MNYGYTDPNLTHNSALACFLLTTFVRTYQARAGGAPAELSKLLLVMPILWHARSCAAIERRQLSTTLQSVLVDDPTLRIDFRRRVEAFAAPTLQGLNLACASGLLERIVDDDEIRLTCTFKQWPRSSRPVEAPPDMLRAIDRIAPWFAEESAARLYQHFLKE